MCQEWCAVVVACMHACTLKTCTSATFLQQSQTHTGMAKRGLCLWIELVWRPLLTSVLQRALVEVFVKVTWNLHVVAVQFVATSWTPIARCSRAAAVSAWGLKRCALMHWPNEEMHHHQALAIDGYAAPHSPGSCMHQQPSASWCCRRMMAWPGGGGV